MRVLQRFDSKQFAVAGRKGDGPGAILPDPGRLIQADKRGIGRDAQCLRCIVILARDHHAFTGEEADRKAPALQRADVFIAGKRLDRFVRFRTDMEDRFGADIPGCLARRAGDRPARGTAPAARG